MFRSIVLPVAVFVNRPKPEVQVCEIEDHGLEADALESGALERFIREHAIEVRGAHGRQTKMTQSAG